MKVDDRHTISEPWPVFLHFFDLHFLAERGYEGQIASVVVAEMDLAVRIALLSSDAVYLPAASYFESRVCREVIDRYADLFPAGLIWLVASGANVYEFAASKMLEYREGSHQHTAYARLLADRDVLHPPFRTRKRSSTADLRQHWIRILETGRAHEVLGRLPGIPPDIEERWGRVPERLGEEAFIVEYVKPLLLPAGVSPLATGRLHAVINSGYFESYAAELQARLVVDMVYLAAPYDVPTLGNDIPYREVRRAFERDGLLDLVRNTTPSDLQSLAADAAIAISMREALDLYAEKHRLNRLRVGYTLAEQTRRFPTDLAPLLAAVKRVAKGRGGSLPTSYQRAVFEFFRAAFAASLGHGRMEVKLHDGRKRVDMSFVNYAATGFFRHVLGDRRTEATHVPVECKNYKKDPGNPELDQLLGRFGLRRGWFGFLTCRHVADRDLMVRRCTDSVRDHRGFVVVLDDGDLERLAAAGQEASDGAPQDQLLRTRFAELEVS